MDNTGGAWITTCRNRWLTYQLLTRLLYAFAATLVVAAVLTPFGHIAPWLYPLICLGCFAALAYARGGMKTDKHHVAAMLNKQFPTLEYSAALLLRPKNTLGPLQQLQVTRLHRSIADIRIGQFANPRVLTGPAVTALVALCVYLAIANLHVSTAPHNGADAIAAAATIPDTRLPPSVADARIVISPPRYTGLPQATQNHLEITAPTGSMISIVLTTTAPVAQMKARFDGQEERRFTAVSTDSLQWELEIEPRKSGFFQLELDGEPSALYPLSVTPDLPISIRVNTPEQHTVIDYGFPERIKLSAFLQDDYAISSAAVVTTISSGKGEGVSFKSGEIPFNNSVNGQKEVRLTQEINLKKLGMVSGDELYFYLKALDNAGQESRSDVFVVVLQDTAELFAMTGMVSGVDLVPQYFRSQRQIIIDTEKLIAEMDTIPVSAAQQRSNNLGIDQQLLRLRYGQFLGEEAEDAIGGHVDHEAHGGHEGHHEHDMRHEHEGHAHEESGENTAEVPVDVEELIAAMSHQHDRAEDATFFNAEQKASLKATLTEMWNTELRLRTHKPQEALPYAYKALRLLKELQQKSRVYVGKSATKTTPLNREKRLTGDLEEVGTPQQRLSASEPTAEQRAQRDLQATLAYLSNLKTSRQLDESGRQLLIKAEEQLMAAAITDPGKYLHALQAIRTLEENSGKTDAGAINVVGKAIHELLPTLNKQPEKRHVAGSNGIYSRYFSEITPK